MVAGETYVGGGGWNCWGCECALNVDMEMGLCRVGADPLNPGCDQAKRWCLDCLTGPFESPRAGRSEELLELDTASEQQRAAQGVKPLGRAQLEHGEVVVSFGSVTDFGGGTDWPPRKLAIVNAANTGGLRGGGVDRAITVAGGVNLAQDRLALPVLAGTQGGRIRTGSAAATGPNLYGSLFSAWVLHAVGPDYAMHQGDLGSGDELLTASYSAAMAVAAENGVEYIGFSLLSAGSFRGSKSLSQVLRIAMDAVKGGAYLGLKEVHLVAFKSDEQSALLELLPAASESGTAGVVESKKGSGGGGSGGDGGGGGGGGVLGSNDGPPDPFRCRCGQDLNEAPAGASGDGAGTCSLCDYEVGDIAYVCELACQGPVCKHCAIDTDLFRICALCETNVPNEAHFVTVRRISRTSICPDEDCGVEVLAGDPSFFCDNCGSVWLCGGCLGRADRTYPRPLTDDGDIGAGDGDDVVNGARLAGSLPAPLQGLSQRQSDDRQLSEWVEGTCFMAQSTGAKAQVLRLVEEIQHSSGYVGLGHARRQLLNASYSLSEDDAGRAVEWALSKHRGEEGWSRGPLQDDAQIPDPDCLLGQVACVRNIGELIGHSNPETDHHYRAISMAPWGGFILSCEDRNPKSVEMDRMATKTQVFVNAPVSLRRDRVVAVLSQLNGGNKLGKMSKWFFTGNKSRMCFKFTPAPRTPGSVEMYKPLSVRVREGRVVIDKVGVTLKWDVQDGGSRSEDAIWATPAGTSQLIASPINVMVAVLARVLANLQSNPGEMCDVYENCCKFGLTFTEGINDQRVVVSTTNPAAPFDFASSLRSMAGEVDSVRVCADTFSPEGDGRSIGELIEVVGYVGDFHMYWDLDVRLDEMLLRLVKVGGVATVIFKPLVRKTQRQRSKDRRERVPAPVLATKGRSPLRRAALQLALRAGCPLIYLDTKIGGSSRKGGNTVGSAFLVTITSTRVGVMGKPKRSQNGQEMRRYGKLVREGGILKTRWTSQRGQAQGQTQSDGARSFAGCPVEMFPAKASESDPRNRAECPRALAADAFDGASSAFLFNGIRMTDEIKLRMLANAQKEGCGPKKDQYSSKGKRDTRRGTQVGCNNCLRLGHKVADCLLCEVCDTYHDETAQTRRACKFAHAARQRAAALVSQRQARAAAQPERSVVRWSARRACAGGSKRRGCPDRPTAATAVGLGGVAVLSHLRPKPDGPAQQQCL